MLIEFHPAIPFLVLAVFYPLLAKSIRPTLQLLAPAVSLLFLLKLGDAVGPIAFRLFNQDLLTLRIDNLSFAFAFIFILFGFAAHLFSRHSDDTKSHVASNIYIASALGAVLAGDLISLFICWELMALASAMLIWNPDRPDSRGALFRYLLIHLTSGLFFFAGLIIHLQSQGDALFGHLGWGLGPQLIFIGFAINAALVPFHMWLPDAYPAGTPTNSIYLSAFTTKVAVYAFARGFAGEELLVTLGIVAAVYGVIFALMEDDMRKLLSYHIICQVGYMVAGIGLGSHAGINAGVGHAFGNILFKGLLFMATGALIHVTGKYKLSELGGLVKKTPVIFAFFMIGALAISGLPFLNGFVTKSMLLDAFEHEHQYLIHFLLLLVAVGTFLSIALKLAYFAFFAEPKHPTPHLHKLPKNMVVAMAFLSAACLAFGLYPKAIFWLLPFETHAHAFSISHIVHTLQLLTGTTLGFLLIRKYLHAKDTVTLDLDWTYRKSARIFLRGIAYPILDLQLYIQAGWSEHLKNLNEWISRTAPKQSIWAIRYTLTFMMSGALLVTFLFYLTR